MVKLVKSALNKVLDNTRRRSSLIELQTFMSDAVRIVIDRPLTTLSSEPNDLSPLFPSCFLGQQLAPYTPLVPSMVVGTFAGTTPIMLT